MKYVIVFFGITTLYGIASEIKYRLELKKFTKLYPDSGRWEEYWKKGPGGMLKS